MPEIENLQGASEIELTQPAVLTTLTASDPFESPNLLLAYHVCCRLRFLKRRMKKC